MNCEHCGFYNCGVVGDDCPRCGTAYDKPVRRPRFRPLPPGTLSNAVITARNGGVQHQFIDDIGGCSANYH
jgi:hypothetical protein